MHFDNLGFLGEVFHYSFAYCYQINVVYSLKLIQFFLFHFFYHNFFCFSWNNQMGFFMMQSQLENNFSEYKELICSP